MGRRASGSRSDAGGAGAPSSAPRPAQRRRAASRGTGFAHGPEERVEGRGHAAADDGGPRVGTRRGGAHRTDSSHEVSGPSVGHLHQKRERVASAEVRARYDRPGARLHGQRLQSLGIVHAAARQPRVHDHRDHRRRRDDHEQARPAARPRPRSGRAASTRRRGASRSSGARRPPPRSRRGGGCSGVVAAQRA